jgi:hypothetical protein
VIQIPHVSGEPKGLIEAVHRRDRLLDLYIGAEDPALIEVLVKKIQDLQTYIDEVRR